MKAATLLVTLPLVLMLGLCTVSSEGAVTIHSECVAYVTYPYYTDGSGNPTGGNATTISATMGQLTGYKSFLQTAGQCYPTIMRLLCYLLYGACRDGKVVRTCTSNCDVLPTSCASIWPLLPAYAKEQFNCSQTSTSCASEPLMTTTGGCVSSGWSASTTVAAATYACTPAGTCVSPSGTPTPPTAPPTAPTPPSPPSTGSPSPPSPPTTKSAALNLRPAALLLVFGLIAALVTLV